MSLKLEVGKTYLSREGKKVKIVEYEDSGEGGNTLEYLGDNGEWYTSRGSFWEDIHDLVSEYVEDQIKENTVDFYYNDFKKGNAAIDEDGDTVNFISDFEGRDVCLGEVVYNVATTALCFVHRTGYLIFQDGTLRKVVSMAPKTQRVYVCVVKSDVKGDTISYSHVNKTTLYTSVEGIVKSTTYKLIGETQIDIELED